MRSRRRRSEMEAGRKTQSRMKRREGSRSRGRGPEVLLEIAGWTVASTRIEVDERLEPPLPAEERDLR